MKFFLTNHLLRFLSQFSPFSRQFWSWVGLVLGLWT